MKSLDRTPDAIKERIKEELIGEMNTVNIITQGKPEIWVPMFVTNLTEKIHILVMDEITFRKRI